MVHWFPDFPASALLPVGCWIPVSSSLQPDRLQDEPNFRTLPASNPSRVASPCPWFFQEMIRPSSEGTESLGIPGLGYILCRAAGFPIIPAGPHSDGR